MRGLAILFATVPLVGSGFVALTGLFWGMGLQCDDTCTGDGWQHTAGAPQWTLLAILGFVVFAAGIALFAFVCRSRPWAALAALLVGFGTIVVALGMWHETVLDDLQRHPVPTGAFALVLLSGAFAALLCAPVKR
jgi:hypothetical protein